jgi:hypothetical protein
MGRDVLRVAERAVTLRRLIGKSDPIWQSGRRLQKWRIFPPWFRLISLISGFLAYSRLAGAGARSETASNPATMFEEVLLFCVRDLVHKLENQQ